MTFFLSFSLPFVPLEEEAAGAVGLLLLVLLREKEG